MGRLPNVGEQYGDFHIESVVGQGGMGVVYAATQNRVDRLVALKVLLPGVGNTSEFRERFEREARTLSGVASPHIVTMYDYGEQDGCLYIATQLIHPGDLQTVLTERGPLPAKKALEIASHIASALEDAHQAGVIHRDVKPSNVLLREGARSYAYLCDFGVAQTADSGLTAVGTVLGTWAYLAPECCDSKPATPASDIYSLGCLLWAMLTGAPPYQGTITQIAQGHLSRPIPRIEPTDPASQTLNDLIQRSMAKDPKDRYSTADAFHNDLFKAVNNASPDRYAKPFEDAAVGIHVAPASDSSEAAPGRANRPPSESSLPSHAETVVRPGRSQLSTGLKAPGPDSRHDSRLKRVAGLVIGALLIGAVVVGGVVAVLNQSGPPKPTNPSSPTASAAPSRPSPAQRQLRLSLASFDRDNKSDIALQLQGSAGPVVALLSDGKRFSTSRIWAHAPYTRHRLNGDFDGDGRADAAILTSSEGVTRVWVRKSLGHRFAPPKLWSIIPVSDPKTSVSGDFNGDGRADILNEAIGGGGRVIFKALLSVKGDKFTKPVVWARNMPWIYRQGRLMPGDFDNDGKTDVVGVIQRGGNLLIQVAYSTGSRLKAPRTEASSAITSLDGSRQVQGDFDGDGRTDVLVFVAGDTGAKALFFRSHPGGISRPRQWWTTPSWDLEKSWLASGDFDADGRWDVARVWDTDRGLTVSVLRSTGTRLKSAGQWGNWPGHSFNNVWLLNRIG